LKKLLNHERLDPAKENLLSNFPYFGVEKIGRALAAFAILFCLFTPQIVIAATQNISFDCAANSFQAPVVPGDLLVITLTANCKTQTSGGGYGNNVTLNSIVSSTGVAKAIAYNTIYVAGDVFTYTVGSNFSGVVVNTTANFSTTTNSAQYAIYARMPNVPTITSISPASGSANGGTTVTITGTSFEVPGANSATTSVVTGVTIGGFPVQSYTVNLTGSASSATISAVTPAGTAGSTSVVVTNTVGSNAANTLFTYATPPTATANSIAAQNLTLTGAMANITPLAGSGGTAPLTYYVISGTLPAGLSLNASTGVIGGTPTATYSTANVVIGVKDATNISASTTSTVSFTVVARPTATTNTTSRTLAVGLPISSFTPITGTGGTAPLNYFTSSGTLPAGLTLDSTTGLVSGTPTTLYPTATVVFGVKDANNITPSASSTSSVSIIVNKGSQTISYTSSAPSNSTVGGDTYTPIVTATSGLAPTLTIDATSSTVCSISGGVVSFTGTGTCKINANQAGNTDYNAAAQVQQSFTVLSRPTAVASTTSQSLIAGTAMASYTPLSGSGGSAPLTYYISSGTLPAGLSLSASTGAVTGTPTGAFATSNIVFSVKDANNSVAITTSTVSFTVTEAPTVTSLTPNSGTTAGGTAVTITGTNFTGATGVTIGGAAATGVTVVSATSITATTPAGAAGTASVVVTTPAGSNAANTLFTYTTPAPVPAAPPALSMDANLSSLSISTGALSPAFASNTNSYTSSVANSVASITITPTRNQASAIITVNGTPVLSGSPSSISLNVGSNTIAITVTAQDGVTKLTYTIAVTRAAALLTQAPLAVSASPSALNATTTTTLISTSGGSGTGAVSYAMTAGSCTLSGTTVSAGAANETCTVLATKAADSTYLAATASVNIAVSRRATLAAAATDASVGKTQGTQLMQTQKFVQTQIQNITSHLDTFRHNFNLMPSSMGVGVMTPSLGPMTPLFYKVKDVWSGNTGESSASGLRKAGMKDGEQLNGTEKLYNDYNNPEEIDEQAAIEQRIHAYERKQETYSFWSVGSIDTGLFKTGDNKDLTNKFRVNGLTFGFDYKVGPRAIVGAALGIGQGTNATQELQSVVKSTQRSLSGYGMLGFGNNWIVDGLLGYSSLTFKGERALSDGSAILSMNRTGSSTFASTSISKIFSIGSLRIAPFVREDLSQIRLGQFAETGATEYALGYDSTRYTLTTASAGLHISNDIYLDHGKLTTTAKLSGNRMRTGSILQDVYYLDSGIAGGVYTLQQNASYQSSRSLNLGLIYSNKAGDGFDFGWMGAMGANQYKLSGLRLAVRFAM
jgi:hypothetical protein